MQGRYIEFVKQTFPKELKLEGLKIVIDCANGAGYEVGPTILWELGAQVIKMGVSPDGFNVNEECGSTHPQAMCARVISEGADLGIALDGDADRLIMCDEKGQLIDGDALMAMIATRWHHSGQLRGGGIVSTHMSNLGLDHYLSGLGLTLHRAPVGDRYVTRKMRETGCNLGGEPSGHMILSDYSTTGDALIAALQVLALICQENKRLSQLSKLLKPVPQLLKNVRYGGGEPLEDAKVKQVISDAQAALGEQGRVFIRKSGTEPLIRIMLEGANEEQIATLADAIAEAINATQTPHLATG